MAYLESKDNGDKSMPLNAGGNQKTLMAMSRKTRAIG
jgi:hypothetical protein